MFNPYRTEIFSIAVNVRRMELLYESFYSLSANKLVPTGFVVVHVASRGRVAICVDSLQKHQCITNKHATIITNLVVIRDIHYYLLQFLSRPSAIFHCPIQVLDLYTSSY